MAQEMDIILKSVNMGRALRARHQIKIRQPLSKITLLTRNETVQGVLGEMAALITDELNVKNVEIARNEEDLVILSAKPNLKLLGPKLGRKLKEIRPQIEALTAKEIVAIQKGGKKSISLNGETFEIGLEELFIERIQREGIVTESEGDVTVALDIHLDEELIAEGFAREFINKVQQTRKEMDLAVTERIGIEFNANAGLRKAIEKHSAYICAETLADRLEFVSKPGDHFTDWVLNDEDCAIRVSQG